MVFSSEAFANSMKLFDLSGQDGIAVAVSGGPDSMALLWLLSEWSQASGKRIYAYTVDHALRPQSATEAAGVASMVSTWPNVVHETLLWEGDKPSSRILEEARSARYALMAQAMAQQGLQSLFVAHQRDDQAETFLIRLAKGSGLDGLSSMRPIQPACGITLCRPLLNVAKGDLIALCQEKGIAYAEDPTNENTRYLRPRLRAAKEILEEEGLSAKRLAVTARRLDRARSALEQISARHFEACLKERRDDGYVFDLKSLRSAPEEIFLRVILAAMGGLRPEEDYAPRLESTENLAARILAEESFNGATLGGCLFAVDRKNETLWIGKEH